MWAISRIEADISSVPAATVCTLRDTWSAALDTSPAWVADSWADPDICPDTLESSCDAEASASALPAMSAIASARRVLAVLSAAAIWPTSSRESRSRCWVSSPSARLRSAVAVWSIGRVIRRATNNERPNVSSSPMPSSM